MTWQNFHVNTKLPPIGYALFALSAGSRPGKASAAAVAMDPEIGMTNSSPLKIIKYPVGERGIPSGKLTWLWKITMLLIGKPEIPSGYLT